MTDEGQQHGSPEVIEIPKQTKIYLAEIQHMQDSTPLTQKDHALLIHEIGLVPYPYAASPHQSGDQLKVYRVLGFDRDHLNSSSSRLIALSVEPQVEDIEIKGKKVLSAELPLDSSTRYAEVTGQNLPISYKNLIYNQPFLIASLPVIINFNAQGIFTGAGNQGKAGERGSWIIYADDNVRASLYWQVNPMGHNDTTVQITEFNQVTPLVWKQTKGLPITGYLTVYPKETTLYTIYAYSPSATPTQYGSQGDGAETYVYVVPGHSPLPPQPQPQPQPQPPPVGHWYYFKMENAASWVNPCFTYAVFANDEPTAKAIAQAQNGGYTATDITYQQYVQGCN